MLARHGSQRLFSGALALILAGALATCWTACCTAMYRFPAVVTTGNGNSRRSNVADNAIHDRRRAADPDELLRVRRSG